MRSSLQVISVLLVPLVATANSVPFVVDPTKMTTTVTQGQPVSRELNGLFEDPEGDEIFVIQDIEQSKDWESGLHVRPGEDSKSFLLAGVPSTTDMQLSPRELRLFAIDSGSGDWLNATLTVHVQPAGAAPNPSTGFGDGDRDQHGNDSFSRPGAAAPTVSPTSSAMVTSDPTTRQPTGYPTPWPTSSVEYQISTPYPTWEPTPYPPTPFPTYEPTTQHPTPMPTDIATPFPTTATASPSTPRTWSPTRKPTVYIPPTITPTHQPTHRPTTGSPTAATQAPTHMNSAPMVNPERAASMHGRVTLRVGKKLDIPLDAYFIDKDDDAVAIIEDPHLRLNPASGLLVEDNHLRGSPNGYDLAMSPTIVHLMALDTEGQTLRQTFTLTIVDPDGLAKADGWASNDALAQSVQQPDELVVPPVPTSNDTPDATAQRARTAPATPSVVVPTPSVEGHTMSVEEYLVATQAMQHDPTPSNASMSAPDLVVGASLSDFDYYETLEERRDDYETVEERREDDAYHAVDHPFSEHTHAPNPPVTVRFGSTSSPTLLTAAPTPATSAPTSTFTMPTPRPWARRTTPPTPPPYTPSSLGVTSYPTSSPTPSPTSTPTSLSTLDFSSRSEKQSTEESPFLVLAPELLNQKMQTGMQYRLPVGGFVVNAHDTTEPLHVFSYSLPQGSGLKVDSQIGQLIGSPNDIDLAHSPMQVELLFTNAHAESTVVTLTLTVCDSASCQPSLSAAPTPTPTVAARAGVDVPKSTPTPTPSSKGSIDWRANPDSERPVRRDAPRNSFLDCVTACVQSRSNGECGLRDHDWSNVCRRLGDGACRVQCEASAISHDGISV